MNVFKRLCATALCTVAIAGCGSDSGPLFSTTSGSTSADSPQLTGTIRYQRLLPGTNLTADSPQRGQSRLDFAHPVASGCRFVHVQALDAANNVLAETATNAQGSYRLVLPNGTGQVKVRVLSETFPVAGFQGGIRVQDNTRNGALYGSDSSLVEPSVGQLDMLLPSGYDAQGVQAEGAVRSASPFACLDGILTGYLFWVSAGVDPTTLPRCVTNWSELNRNTKGDTNTGAIETSHFTSGTNQLFILGDKNTDTDEHDWHVMVHEFGHWIQFNRFRANGGGGNHGSGDIKDPRLAFGEGFGNATGGLALNDPIYRDTDSGNGSCHSMERNLSLSDPNPGWFSEASVEAMILDLFDPVGLEAGSNFQDNLALPVTRLREAMDYQKASPALTTIFSFLAGLRANGVLLSDLEPLLASVTINANFGINSVDDFAAGETHSAGVDTALPVYLDVTSLVSRANSDQQPVSLSLKRQLSTVDNWMQGNKLWKFIGDGQPLGVLIQNSTSAVGNVNLEVYEDGRSIGSRVPATPTTDVVWLFPTTVPGRVYILDFTNQGQTDTTVQVLFEH
ncbi:MAG: hypothetical protein J0I12_14215 [Candidatus Eremiobacteraeota bacterium]|nr:hypothetical protein [Candidatus Eremiobacteraeota bacterium]